MTAIYALTIVFAIYASGDLVSYYSKSRVPSSLFRTMLILGLLWTKILPENTFSSSTISGFGMMAVTLMIVMLGTTIDTPELKRQVKTIIVCLTGIVISTALIVLVGPLLIDDQFAYVGSAVYAGGSAVILMLTSALKPLGLTDVIGFFTILGTAQGLIGQPVCAFFLRRYAKEFLADPANIEKWAAEETPAIGGKKRKIFEMPAGLNRLPVMFLKIALLASLANFLAGLTGGTLHAFVISIILGWISVETGFLPKNVMGRLESAGLITFLAACVLFGNLVGITPTMFLSYIIPIIVVMALGIIGTIIAGVALSGILKMPAGLGVALGLCCTMGFPTTMILTDDVCDAMAKTPEERKALYNVLMPKMLVAGFVTVTMASMLVGSFVLSVYF